MLMNGPCKTCSTPLVEEKDSSPSFAVDVDGGAKRVKHWVEDKAQFIWVSLNTRYHISTCTLTWIGQSFDTNTCVFIIGCSLLYKWGIYWINWSFLTLSLHEPPFITAIHLISDSRWRTHFLRMLSRLHESRDISSSKSLGLKKNSKARGILRRD